MTFSELLEPLRSQIVQMTADFSHWFVSYHSDLQSTAMYFNSYENTSFRGIVEGTVQSDESITWLGGRLPNYEHSTNNRWLAGVRYGNQTLSTAATSALQCVNSSAYIEPRCMMPNLQNRTADQGREERWPHQIVNDECPRFAAMKLSVREGLAHRYTEVSVQIRYCLMFCVCRVLTMLHYEIV
jgi:hypothetical protein